MYDLVLLISGRPKVQPRPRSNFKNCHFRHPLIAKRCTGNELTLDNFRELGKDFVSKNPHAKEKDEKSISNTTSLRLNKVFLLQ